MVGISGSNDNLITPPATPPTQPVPQANVVPPIPDPVTTETPEDLDAQWTRWKCAVCNYTYEGRNPLKKCPRCGNEDPDKFVDAD